MTNLIDAVQAAVLGDMNPAYAFLAELDAAYDAKRAAETKVVAWITASGKVATSQRKTPADAEEFAASLRAAGKADVEVVDA